MDNLRIVKVQKQKTKEGVTLSTSKLSIGNTDFLQTEQTFDLVLFDKLR
jgi:hypothetical protein